MVLIAELKNFATRGGLFTMARRAALALVTSRRRRIRPWTSAPSGPASSAKLRARLRYNCERARAPASLHAFVQRTNCKSKKESILRGSARRASGARPLRAALRHIVCHTCICGYIWLRRCYGRRCVVLCECWVLCACARPRCAACPFGSYSQPSLSSSRTLRLLSAAPIFYVASLRLASSISLRRVYRLGREEAIASLQL